MSGMRRRAKAFMALFEKHAPVGEWITARDLAEATHKGRPRKDVSLAAKDYSRTLSNLQRYGHVQRRRGSGPYEYAQVHTKNVIISSWFPQPMGGARMGPKRRTP